MPMAKINAIPGHCGRIEPEPGHRRLFLSMRDHETGGGARVTVGVDIGGTKVAAALLDGQGRMLARTKVPTRAEEGFATSLAQVVGVVTEMLSRARAQGLSVHALGVGCPGPLDPRAGVVYRPPNLPGWDEVPIRSLLEEETGMPVCVDNDGNLAALAEATFGCGRGVGHLVHFTLGTGVGGGVVAGDKIYHGKRGAAAELGHLVVEAGGRPCRCGGKGCLEAYVSGPSLVRRTEEALEAGGYSALLRPGQELTPARVTEAARAGDPLAKAIWEETIAYLAAGVVSAVHAFNPAVVVIGGGMADIGDMLFSPLRRLVEKWVMAYPGQGLRILPSCLGADAGVVGAAWLAWGSEEVGHGESGR